MDKNYNFERKKLMLPEYGRHIHQMVDYLCTIEDRALRNEQAQVVVEVMGNINPVLRDATDFKHKLWDHLLIMSDFKLDIDYPCEVIPKESLQSKPEKVPYKLTPIRYRHYGKIIERLIDIASEMPEGEERENLSMLIAQHMKKLLLQVNNEGVEDEKVFKDLAEYSRGRIVLDPATHHLRDFKELIQPSNQNSGKKSKKRK